MSDAGDRPLVRLLRRPGVRRLGLGLFTLYVLVLAGTAITVSTVEVDFGVQVWSDGRLVPGRTSGVRVAVNNPTDRRYLQGFEARGRLETPDGAVRRELFSAATPALGLSWTVEVPADFPPGPARLVVEARRGSREDVCTASVRVGPPPERPPAEPEDPGKAEPEEDRPRVHVDLLAASGALVPELEQPLLVRTTGPDGAPAPEVDLALTLRRGAMDGLPETVRTDAAGLAVMIVRPRFHDLAVAVGPPGEKPQEVNLRSKPAQFSARVGRPLLDPGRALGVHIDSMHGSGEVHADLWAEGRWVGAASGLLRSGEARVGLPPPGAHERPVLLQIYRHFAAPGKARFVAARLATTDPAAAVPALARELARRNVETPWIAALQARGLLAAPPDRDLLALWLLARWPDRPPEPPLLAETGRARQAEATAHRDRTRGRVVAALAVTGVLLLLVIVYMLVFHVLQLERRWREVRGEEDFRSLRRARAWWEAGLILFTLAVAITGLIVMLHSLTWGVDLTR